MLSAKLDTTLTTGGPPVAKKPPSAAAKRHMARVADLPCLVSGKTPVTIHHCTAYADRPGRFARSDWLVVPLAPEYHLIQFGPKTSVEALGHQGFFEAYGIDLLAEAERLRDWSLEQEARAA